MAAATPRAAADRIRVYTIGHSTREFSEVVDMLRANGVDTLVDVRSFPGSRKHPQWKQASIEHELPPDIDYRWIKAIGGRRHTPAGTPTPNEGWRVKAFRDYADYMSTDEFHAGLDELVSIAQASTPAIMCSEAVPWRCHRRLITDALLVRGIEVCHIMSPTSVRPAELTPFARVDGEQITYPATDESSGDEASPEDS